MYLYCLILSAHFAQVIVPGAFVVKRRQFYNNNKTIQYNLRESTSLQSCVKTLKLNANNTLKTKQ